MLKNYINNESSTNVYVKQINTFWRNISTSESKSRYKMHRNHNVIMEINGFIILDFLKHGEKIAFSITSLNIICFLGNTSMNIHLIVKTYTCLGF